MQEPDAGRKDIENRTRSGSRQKQTEKERTYYMELAICSFASSSSGNSFLIQSSTTRIIADVGVSMKKMDESLKQFTTVYPAAGDDHSAVKLTIPELEEAAGAMGWVDVCRETV